jgi:hypothetical protein
VLFVQYMSLYSSYILTDIITVIMIGFVLLPAAYRIVDSAVVYAAFIIRITKFVDFSIFYS